MQKVTLTIENSYDSQVVRLEDELSIGRTNQADVVLNDGGLSRKNTTFFRDGEDILIVDENSTNGTFLNGERLSTAPRVLKDGDRIKLGNDTRILVEIGETFTREAEFHRETQKTETPKSGVYDIRLGKYRNEDQSFPETKTETFTPQKDNSAKLLLAAGLSTFAIIFLAGIAFLVASKYEGNTAKNNGKPTPQISAQAV
nr:FHA domain-containing protein [Pyrinomonadaceae bacterium]